MAQQKWIKWIVGLSGVAVFTGFVGLISANGETKSAPTSISRAAPWRKATIRSPTSGKVRRTKTGRAASDAAAEAASAA